ncbi:MAG TPA: hypothetical protein VEW28_07050 [Candidatus Kapabacteria bacterium]|nr:hypothetical protein [Candidatus Kapabacteria bacterium]
MTGCSNKPTEPPPVTAPTTDLNVAANHLFPPRLGEYYLVWVQYVSDPIWHLVDTLTIGHIFANDSSNNLFHNKNISSADSLHAAMISLERSLNPSAPTLPLLSGTFVKNDTALLAWLSIDIAGDFSKLSSTLVFTTSNAQATNDSEFYLCKYNGTSFLPSLENLPLVPAAWKYGLWAVDSNFYPTQRIFYGLFTGPSGHDSDSINDNLPFPGGAKKPAMNQRTGSILVTLEPNWYTMQTLVGLGPASYPVLRFDRRINITRDSNYAMTNVSAGLPAAIITVQQK